MSYLEPDQRALSKKGLIAAPESSPSRYRIFEVDRERDREEIIALWRRNLLPVSADRYAWIYADPFGSRSEGWVAKTDSGEVVGFTGLLYRTMKLADRRIEVGQAVDLVVDPAHRAFGPIPDLQRTLIGSVRRRGIPFVYAFPNRRLEKVFHRLGYRHLAGMARWTKPLRSEGWIRKYFPFAGGAKISAFLIDTLLKWNTKERSYKRPAWGTFEITHRFDSRFDDLDRRGAAQYDLVGERTAAYLNWRFGQSPHMSYRVLSLSDRGGRLLGYIVFSCQSGAAQIADLFAEPIDCLDPLLGELIFIMRSEGISSVGFYCSGSAQRSSLLAEWGFYKRPGETGMMVLFNDDFPHVESLFNRGHWHLTEGDRDV